MSVLDVQTLLAHEAFVRRVTRALVRDEHDADDVVQATFLAAMERPPRDGANVRGWLASVARNLARRTHRSRERESRRRDRLRRPDPVRRPDEAAQRSEVEHTVMDAVLALDERYREVVLCRYRDGLSATECATRMGVAPGTVKTRLRRALETLRARLDRKHGGRAAWAVALGFVPSRAAAAAVSMGVVMGKFAKVALVLALVAAGLLVWWSVDPGAAERRTEAAREAGVRTEEAPRPVVKPEAPAPEPEPAVTRREEKPADTPPPVPESGPKRVVGRIVDAAGRGVRGVQVMAYRDGKRKRIAMTDPRGWFSLGGLDGAYKLVILRGVVTASEYNHLAELPGVFRTGDPGTRFDFKGMHGRLLDAEGKPVKRGIVLARRVGEDLVLTAVDVMPSGHFAFYDMDEGSYRLSYKTGIAGSETMTVLGGEHVTARETGIELRLAPGDTIEGIVMDEAGRPKPGVWVRTTVGTTLTGDTTDGEGRFRIQGLEANTAYALTTWLQGYVPEVREGIRAGSRGLHFRLDPGLTTTGQLLDAAGRPVPDTDLRVRPASGRGLPLYPKTDEEGRFVLRGLPDETIRIRAGKAEWEIRAGARDVVLRLE